MTRRELLLATPLIIAAGCGGGDTAPTSNPQIAELINQLYDTRHLWRERNSSFSWYTLNVQFASEATGQAWEIKTTDFNTNVNSSVVSATPELTEEQRAAIFAQFGSVEYIYDYYIRKAQQLLTNPNVESYNVATSGSHVPTSEELVLKSGASGGQLTDRVTVTGFRTLSA